jgi:hypothetical protein
MDEDFDVQVAQAEEPRVFVEQTQPGDRCLDLCFVRCLPGVP